ncbi:hypothetical protein VII00023_12101 [Vibrio ichthyoenteri ATCC 700023]|uniref:Uncharacterized protein n=1 Tax=Vibrio ichthyoenteri ATCC 700023 TaxID=870968 RepID=F9RYQ3_9VIBR|nr:hypothetical protein VII00023_12101 [Vibrio ichthyoenteri ATCC 700023]
MQFIAHKAKRSSVTRVWDALWRGYAVLQGEIYDKQKVWGWKY